jgi:predicted DNA-binding transcriptional regulator AlpA
VGERTWRRRDIRVMGVSEIARRLGNTPQWTSQLVNRREFPEPLARLAMGQVWLADDVEAWIAEHRPHLDDPDEA